MSTRSAIIVKTGNQYRGIYCHFDGYISKQVGVAKELFENYQDEKKINELVDLGSISFLKEKVHPTSEHSFNGIKEEGVTLAYHRDRGEDLVICTGKSSEKVADQIGHNGYVYVFENGSWKVNGIDLKDAIEEAED